MDLENFCFNIIYTILIKILIFTHWWNWITLSTSIIWWTYTSKTIIARFDTSSTIVTWIWMTWAFKINYFNEFLYPSLIFQLILLCGLVG